MSHELLAMGYELAVSIKKDSLYTKNSDVYR